MIGAVGDALLLAERGRSVVLLEASGIPLKTPAA